jgi:hypothetical protein
MCTLGNIVLDANIPVVSDDAGYFDISVPIGNHYITVKKTVASLPTTDDSLQHQEPNFLKIQTKQLLFLLIIPALP